MTKQQMTRIEGEGYGNAAWSERDNFSTREQAEGYVEMLARQYPVTPYRIRESEGRFVVEYVPAWVTERRAEAERIASAEGFAISEHDEDWTFFTLDDPLAVGPTGTDGRGFLAGRTLRTHFTWEAGRFEGFVS